MKILALSDIHGCLDYLPAIGNELSEADIVMLAGDITNFGGRESIRKIVKSLAQYNTHILAVPGNCDGPGVNDYLSEKKVNLHCNCIISKDYAFFGVGGSLPCAELTPFESGEHDFISLLEKVEHAIATSERRILLIHQPPWGTKVDVISNKHTGSTALRDFILEHEPMLAVCGHVHEAVGIDKLGTTTVVNPGPFRNGLYAVITVGDSVEHIELKAAN